VLEAQIEKLGLSGRVVLGEYLSLEEIRGIICQSDIGVVPYHSDTFMNLALSTKTFEYVAMRLPVVASRVASLQNIFDENSIKYFDPGRVDDLAGKITEFCLNPEMRKSYAQRAKLAYTEISWQIMGNRYINLVNNQVNGIRFEPHTTSSTPRVY
jgi:glycosyltransferase involved in cell wall biosynthesis